MQQLGPARDWDVFAETTVTRLVAAAPDVDLGGLREAVERQRKSSYGVLQTVLVDPRCNRFLLSLGQLVERRGWRNEIDSEALAVLSLPMPTLADKILARCIARRSGVARISGSSTSMRSTISGSTSRSCAMRRSSFCRFMPRMAPARRYVRRLARLQTSLGRARDIASSRILLGSHRAGRRACASSRHRRSGWLASPRSDCCGKNAAQEMAAVQSDARILGPVSSSLAPGDLVACGQTTEGHVARSRLVYTELCKGRNMNCRRNTIFGAALCAAAAATAPSAAFAQSTFRNYRCADGTQFIVGFFQYRFPRPSAARRQGGDAGQAAWRCRDRVIRRSGVTLTDHQGRGHDAQACQAAGHDMRAADMKKGRNAVRSDPFLLHRPRLDFGRAPVKHLPRHQWSRSLLGVLDGRCVVPAAAAVARLTGWAVNLGRSWSRHSDVPREPRGPRLGIGRSWQTLDSNPYSSCQSLLLSKR